MPSFLQKEALLRVHQVCFARRDVEKERVKLIDVAQGPDPFAVRFALGIGIRVKIIVYHPAFGWHFLNATDAIAEVAPKFSNIIRPRKATRDPNNGDLLTDGWFG